MDYVAWDGVHRGWHYTNTLHIVDLKTGNGPVGARENTQLMIYALGAMAVVVRERRSGSPSPSS